MATQQVNEISKGAQVLESRGISRRKFLGYCAGIATMIGLSQTAAPQIAEALESVIGNSEGNLKPSSGLRALRARAALRLLLRSILLMCRPLSWSCFR